LFLETEASRPASCQVLFDRSGLLDSARHQNDEQARSDKTLPERACCYFMIVPVYLKLI